MSSWRPRNSTARALAAIQNQLTQLNVKMGAIMTALDNLQAADIALKAEVATVITDWAAALASAGASDPAIQAVADDMTAQVAALTGADPANAVPPVTPTA